MGFLDILNTLYRICSTFWWTFEKKLENYYVIYIKYRQFWYRSSATRHIFGAMKKLYFFYFINILWTYFSKYHDWHFAISTKLFAVFLAAQAYWKYMPVVKLLQNITLLLAHFATQCPVSGANILLRWLLQQFIIWLKG